MFDSEYEVASQLKEILQKRLGIEIDAHEIGYVALHIFTQQSRMRAYRQQCGTDDRSNLQMCAGSGAGERKKRSMSCLCI